MGLKSRPTVKMEESSSSVTRIPLKSANKRNMVTRINTFLAILVMLDHDPPEPLQTTVKKR